MQALFGTIVVPVDFTLNTRVAIEKAMELGRSGSVIHLLHVERNGRLASAFPELAGGSGAAAASGTREATGEELLNWKRHIQELQPDRNVTIEMAKDTAVQKAIIRKAAKEDADLIIIGKRSGRSSLFFRDTVQPGRLAKKASCAVLTVRPAALEQPAKTIVVPVTDETVQNKMAVIKALCRKGKLNIHLISFTNDRKASGAGSPVSLLKLFQWVKGTIHCPVVFTLLHGYNVASCLLRYAQQIDADILLVHPVSETSMGWWKGSIEDALPTASKMQVLAVPPHLNS